MVAIFNSGDPRRSQEILKSIENILMATLNYLSVIDCERDDAKRIK